MAHIGQLGHGLYALAREELPRGKRQHAVFYKRGGALMKRLRTIPKTGLMRQGREYTAAICLLGINGELGDHHLRIMLARGGDHRIQKARAQPIVLPNKQQIAPAGDAACGSAAARHRIVVHRDRFNAYITVDKAFAHRCGPIARGAVGNNKLKVFVVLVKYALYSAR